MKDNFKSGQVVLFVIVILVVSLIIVSSVMNRSLSGLKTTNIDTDSTRALSAAESGIEEILSRSGSELNALIGQSKPISAVDPNLIGSSNYTVTAQSTTYVETPDALPADSLVQFDFTGSYSSGSVAVIYYDSPACLLISFISTTNAVTRRLICGRSVSNVEGEDPWSEGSGGTGYGYSRTLSFSNTKFFLVKILNGSTRIRLTGGTVLNNLATKFIRGTASATTKTNVKKEVEVITKTSKDIYPVFDYALYIK